MTNSNFKKLKKMAILGFSQSKFLATPVLHNISVLLHVKVGYQYR